MKHLLILSLITLAACAKKDEPTPPVVKPLASVWTTPDGTTYDFSLDWQSAGIEIRTTSLTCRVLGLKQGETQGLIHLYNAEPTAACALMNRDVSFLKTNTELIICDINECEVWK